MSKGEQTRERILERAAALFNRRGYSGASLSDVMEATGLKKGGIYRHFDSKERLAVDAFDFAIQRMSERFRDALAGKATAPERLRAALGVFSDQFADPPVPGGCPVMNTAIESDDGNPVLREHARTAMSNLRGMFRRIIDRGQSRGELRADLDPDQLTTVLVGGIEGALMLSKLYGDPVHLERMRAHLERYIDDELCAG